MDSWKNRIAEHPVDPEFIERVSTRAFDPIKAIDHNTLMSCFEAARWAPSSFNNQPWRYVYAHKGSKAFETMMSCLVDFNKMWCQNAAVLVIICSRSQFTHNNKDCMTASLDTGASYMSLCFQAAKLGIKSHAMEGIFRDKIKELFSIPEGFKVEAMLALGYQGQIDNLPEELKDKEVPTQRKPLKDTVSEANFTFN